jgi:hypothetical protein
MADFVEKVVQCGLSSHSSRHEFVHMEAAMKLFDLTGRAALVTGASLRHQKATAFMRLAVRAGLSAAVLIFDKEKLTGLSLRGGQRRSTMSFAAVISPARALSIMARQMSSAAPSNRRSTKRVAWFFAPLGFPAGLPELPARNLRFALPKGAQAAHDPSFHFESSCARSFSG